MHEGVETAGRAKVLQRLKSLRDLQVALGVSEMNVDTLEMQETEVRARNIAKDPLLLSEKQRFSERSIPVNGSGTRPRTFFGGYPSSQSPAGWWRRAGSCLRAHRGVGCGSSRRSALGRHAHCALLAIAGTPNRGERRPQRRPLDFPPLVALAKQLLMCVLRHVL